MNKQEAIDILTGLYRIPVENGAYELAQEINKAIDMAIEALSADRTTGECRTCARNADNGGYYEPEHRTRCPIQEHYALLLDGYCHLYEPYDCGAKMGGDDE